MAENRELALVLKLVADNFQSELRKSGGMLGEFSSIIKDWKTQLATAGTVLFTIAKITANYGEEALKASQKLGMTVEKFTAMRHAANLSDLSADQLTLGIKSLSVNMAEASRQTGDGEALFRRLGIAATTATGQLRPTEDVLLDVADAFAKHKDGAGKAEVATKLFGKAGLDLIPFLNQGKAAIRDMQEEARRLGLTMSKEDAMAADEFNNELKKMVASSRGMTLAVGKELIPVMTDLLKIFNSFNVESSVNKGLAAIHQSVVGLVTGFKNLQAAAQFLSGTGHDALSLDGLKQRLADNQLEAQRKLFEHSNPGVLTSPSGSSTGGSSNEKKEIQQLNTADAFKGTGDLMVDVFKQRLGTEKESFHLFLQGLISQGRELTEAFSGTGDGMVKVFEDRRAQFHAERDELIENAGAWVNYYEELGGDTENFYGHKMDLLRAQLAKELQLNKQQAAELLFAWQNHDSARAEQIMADSPVSDTRKETIELNTMRQATVNLQETSGDFFEGWAKGMRKYSRDTQSGFGLAADMARRTAQMMEQGFKTFFFDALEGRITSLKDVLKSLLDFAKNIVAQVGAQLVTRQLVGAFAGAGSGGGANLPKFALGGVGDFGAGSMAVLHGREAVVPLPDGRSIPVAMKAAGNGGGTGAGGNVTFIVNNYSDAKVEQPRSSRGADGRQTITMLIRQEVKAAFSDGSMDNSMRRYGSNPQPFGR